MVVQVTPAKDQTAIGLIRPAVEITAKWGWAAVPEPVKHATLIVAAGRGRFAVEWLLTFSYASSQSGIEDRIALDTERFWGPVERLSDTVAGLARVDIAPQGLNDSVDGVVESSFSVIATYRLDAAVITS